MAFNQNIIEQLKNQETTLTGTVDPTSVTPEFIGQIYINTTADTVWVAKSLVAGDFIETGSGGGGGAIEIQEDDVQITAACDTLNFEGDGVDSVFDEGAGKTTVTISGGGGALTGVVGGDKYVDRGDPSAFDFTSGDFTKDATYRDLDLSSILPPEAAGRLVHLTVQVNTTVGGGGIYFREKGLVNGHNVAGVNSAEPNKVHTEDILVKCDDNRVIQYYAVTGYTWTNLDMVVRGWYKEELVDTELTGEEYEDRGDVAAYDFEVGDFVSDGAYHELDLSGILPPEAAGQLVHLGTLLRKTTNGSASFSLRSADFSNEFNVFTTSGQNANYNIAGDGWVRCDENRKVAYRLSPTTWTYVSVVIRGWNISKVGGSRNAVIGGVEYIDRGDTTGAYDWFNVFNPDGNWHTLDMSSIVPSEAANKRVLIKMTITATDKGCEIFIREKGSSDLVNNAYMRGVSGSGDFWVTCDNNRQVEYKVNQVGGTISALGVLVRGWERQATIDHLVRGDEYVDRGNAFSADFDVGDLTADSNWNELDLSGILPPEAAGQLISIHMYCDNNVTNAGFFLKETSHTGATYNYAGITTHNTLGNHADVWVKCDENRKILYKLSSTGTWSIASLRIRGWMKTSDGGAVAGTKYVDRGDIVAWDFLSPGSLTIDSAWHTLDLSGILPEAAANQLIHFRQQMTDTSNTLAFSVSHPDSTSGYNNAQLYSKGNATCQDIFVKCNANREVVYRAASGIDSVVLAVRGWFKPIDKGHAIQPTYGAPVVHMEYKDANTITVKAGRYFVDGGWYELESDLDWTWSASGQNFGVDTGGGEANGWWYLYTFLHGDRPAVVASQTPPTGAYDTDLSGTAYDKNIYLGAYYNDSGSIREFYQSGRDFFYSQHQDVVTTTSNTYQSKTIGVPYTADQVLGLINLQNSGSSTPGNAFYSPNGVSTYVWVGPRNNESTTGGHYSQFIAPIVTPQTGYIRNGTGVATNTAQMWTLGWKDKFLR